MIDASKGCRGEKRLRAVALIGSESCSVATVFCVNEASIAIGEPKAISDEELVHSHQGRCMVCCHSLESCVSLFNDSSPPQIHSSSKRQRTRRVVVEVTRNEGAYSLSSYVDGLESKDHSIEAKCVIITFILTTANRPAHTYPTSSGSIHGMRGASREIIIDTGRPVS